MFCLPPAFNNHCVSQIHIPVITLPAKLYTLIYLMYTVPGLKRYQCFYHKDRHNVLKTAVWYFCWELPKFPYQNHEKTTFVVISLSKRHLKGYSYYYFFYPIKNLQSALFHIHSVEYLKYRMSKISAQVYIQGQVCNQMMDHKERLNTSGETRNLQGSMS